MASILRHMWLLLASLSLLSGTLLAESKVLEHRFHFAQPKVTTTAHGHCTITLPACEPYAQASKPILPVHPCRLELPPGYQVAKFTIVSDSTNTLKLTTLPQWGQLPVRPGESPDLSLLPDPAIYSGQEVFPASTIPDWHLDTSRDTPILSFLIYPVQYAPRHNRLHYATLVDVIIELERIPPQRERLDLTPPLLDPTQPISYLVIAPAELIAPTNNPHWSLTALCQAHEADGHTTAIIDRDWILANYGGENIPAQIRAFVQDARRVWGVRYLLLVGTFELIPTQHLDVKVKVFLTSYASSIPADAVYYGCLDGPFDGNGNGLYGELDDGANGGDVDLIPDVAVGRFPVKNSTELEHMVRKTLHHKNAAAHHFVPNAFIGEVVNFGNTIYATPLLDQLRYGVKAFDLDAQGFKSSIYADLMNADYTLYDSDEYLWDTADALNFLNHDHFTIHHIGHGATQQGMRLNLQSPQGRRQLAELTNDFPYLVYSQACDVGAFDRNDCFAQQIVTVTNAAVATIAGARESWFLTTQLGGYTHRYHRAFIDAALRGKVTTLGEIHMASMEANLALINRQHADHWRWTHYELNLFGDPALPFAPSLNLTLPTFEHTALRNTFITDQPYQIECALAPTGIYNPLTLNLQWFTTQAPDTIHTQSMTRVLGNHYTANIPPHPLHTTLFYKIQVDSYAGLTSQWPTNDTWSTFGITPRVELQILGSPTNLGQPSPTYGTWSLAAGNAVHFDAPLTVPVTDGTRYFCAGYTGNGNIDQYGTTNYLHTTISTDTTLLLWFWQLQHRLTVMPHDQTYWSAEHTLHPIITAAETITSNAQTLAFAQWHLDGIRYPGEDGESPPTLSLLQADMPHLLEAHYLPAEQDLDGNGIADWWELRYYGTTGLDPASDDDDDGFSLREEFADRTDPHDPRSQPAPPHIVHLPLEEIQRRAGPFAIQAQISDTHCVATATVYWRLLKAPTTWHQSTMQNSATNHFEALIAPTTNPGDDFEYYIVATDPAGYCAQTDTNFFWLVYPVADTSRLHDVYQWSYATSMPQELSMNLHNAGNAPLTWSFNYGLHHSFDTPLPATWSLAHIPATNRDWQLSTNRFVSPPYAMHSQNSSAHSLYTPNLATLTTPPLQLGQHAKLKFDYWIHDEEDQGTPGQTWDGGIVEISVDNGQTFVHLPGPYTHHMTAWTASPWPDGTPCFSGAGTEGWRHAEFDLTDYQGQTVMLRFAHGGDNNTNYEGWYIDNLNIITGRLPPGFQHLPQNIPSATLPQGDLQRILWRVDPPLLLERDNHISIFIISNDPVHPVQTFDWYHYLRDQPPQLDLAHLTQHRDGSGHADLTLDFHLKDPDPITFALEWSLDNRHTWQPVTLAETPSNVLSLPASPHTNQLITTLQTQPTIDLSTQLYLRVTAQIPLFSTNITYGPFVIDNQPPVFAPGAIDTVPAGSAAHYAIAWDNQINFTWPPAHDAYSTNVNYILQLTNPTNACLATSPLHSNLVTHTLSTAFMEVENLVTVSAYDEFGNTATLKRSLLLLDPAGDYDGDGLTTAEEELRGWDATTFTCPLSLAADSPVWLHFSCPTVPGYHYTVEVSDTLTPATWQALAPYVQVAGDGKPLLISLPKQKTAQFMRVIVGRGSAAPQSAVGSRQW